MDIYLITLVLLAGLAIFDLVVGVSNDAVNFLNSSIGSRVAPRHVILIVASFGMLAGVTFSSGMMEVARKGIFHPSLFCMPELLTIFLAVMLTDILLLDLFNTFGLPRPPLYRSFLNCWGPPWRCPSLKYSWPMKASWRCQIILTPEKR